MGLHVTDFGGPADAIPLLLMHGGMAHGAWWGPLARALRHELRPFALDRRGHGRSDWVEIDKYGWMRDLIDAESVTRALAPGPWLVAGHSQGGLLSVHLAVRGRIPMCGLVVLDAPLDPRSPSLVRMGKSLRRVPQVRYPTLESALRRFQPYPAPHRVADDVLAEIAQESFKPADDGGWVSRFHWKRFQADDGPTHPLEDFQSDIARVAVPALVVRAGESTILSARDHQTFVQRLPDGCGAEVPGATHSLHVEQPGAVAEHILSFASALR